MLFAVTLAAIVWISLLRAGNEQTEMILAQKPALFCLPWDQATFDGLRNGDMQLVAIFKSYDPQGGTNHSFKASIVGADGTSRFGLFPGSPFKAKSEKEYQKFRIAFGKSMNSFDHSERLCLKISFEGQGDEATKGKAEVSVEIVKTEG